MNTTAVTRFMAIIASRRRLLGTSLTLAGLAMTPVIDDELSAHGPTRWQRRRRQQNQRQQRRNNRGRNGLGDGPCDVCEDGCLYSTIQGAIDGIEIDQSDITITVCAGTYKERINIAAFQVENVTILGAGPEETTIDAEGDGTAITIDRGVLLTIEGFTITGGKAPFGGGIVNRGLLTLDSCIVTDNDTGLAVGGGGGIYNDRGNLTLLSTDVSDNASSAGQGGGILNNGGQLALQGGSRVTENRAHQGGGIFNQGSGTVAVDGSSSVTDNEPDNCVGTTACGA